MGCGRDPPTRIWPASCHGPRFIIVFDRGRYIMPAIPYRGEPRSRPMQYALKQGEARVWRSTLLAGTDRWPKRMPTRNPRIAGFIPLPTCGRAEGSPNGGKRAPDAVVEAPEVAGTGRVSCSTNCWRMYLTVPVRVPHDVACAQGFAAAARHRCAGQFEFPRR